jgi:uncharacterized protein (TIGR00369 family)
MTTTSAAARRERTIHWEDPLATVRAGARMSGRDYLEAITRGELPPPPIGQLLGFTFEEIAEGRVRMRLAPAEYHYNPIGVVHGGVAATLLDSVMGCAVHSALPAGRGYTTLEIKVNYLKAMRIDTGEVAAEGRVVQIGRQIAMAEGRITDKEGLIYAAGTTTCLLLDHPPERGSAGK